MQQLSISQSLRRTFAIRLAPSGFKLARSRSSSHFRDRARTSMIRLALPGSSSHFRYSKFFVASREALRVFPRERLSELLLNHCRIRDRLRRKVIVRIEIELFYQR